MTQKPVIIIGGGPSGVMAAVDLLKSGVSVTLIDQGNIGGGIIGATHDPHHRFNVHAAKMGMDPAKQDFLAYVRENGHPDASDSTYLPRTLYNEYHRQLLREAEEIGKKKGATLTREEHADVIDVRFEGTGEARTATVTIDAIRNDDGHQIVTLRNASTIKGSDVIIAASNFLSSEVPFGGALPHELFDRSPWHLSLHSPFSEQLNDSRIFGDVLGIGGGLSGVDWAMRAAGKATGTIYLVAPGGVLPEVHGTPDPQGRPALTEEAPAFRAALLEQTTAKGVWDTIETWSESYDPRTVVDAMRPKPEGVETNRVTTTDAVWHRLPEDEKAIFVRDYLSHWNKLRHRMPPETAQEIAQLRESGRLVILDGRVTGATQNQNTGDIDVVIQTSQGEKTTLPVAHLTDCRAPTLDITKIPLLSTLAERGYVTPGPVGLGVNIDDDGHPIGRNGEVTEGLHVIGALRRGKDFETTAIPELRPQAAKTAKEIVEERGRWFKVVSSDVKQDVRIENQRDIDRANDGPATGVNFDI